MKYGIFSDVHSNLEALTAVLTFFKKEGVEQALCLGDIVGYGANPKECIAQIRSLGGVVIAGNHDWACVDRMKMDYFNMYAREAILWTRQQLNEEEEAFLKNLEPSYQTELLTLVHGSLDFPEEFRYIFDAESATRTLELSKTPVCFVGHSHLPMIFSLGQDGYVRLSRSGNLKLQEGVKVLVNDGSVGQPRDGDPRAACALLDTDQQTVEIRRLPYDIRLAQQKILQAGLPPVLASRLSEGQ